MEILEYNKPIDNGEFFEKININSQIYLKTEVKEVIQARSNKHVYRVSCEDNNLYRFDFGKRYMFNIEEQKIASNFVNIPKLILYIPKGRCRISEWIDGLNIKEFINNSEVLIKSGELMAKLNLIEKDNWFLSNSEFSTINAIWTGKEVWLVDLGKLIWSQNKTKDIAQILLKRIRYMSRINLFLEGYIKYNPNDYKEIISECNNLNWKWYDKGSVINDECLKNYI